MSEQHLAQAVFDAQATKIHRLEQELAAVQCKYVACAEALADTLQEHRELQEAHREFVKVCRNSNDLIYDVPRALAELERGGGRNERGVRGSHEALALAGVEAQR